MIEAAADGSSLGNPGPAGWGWYVDDQQWARGGWPRGTNNMGELMALLDLLRQSADLDEDLTVYCDSKYVIDTVTKWIPGWKRRGWRKADGHPVLNLDLIQPIDELMQARREAGRRVELVWVKGHAGHPLNEQADRLANGAAAAYQAGQVPEPGPGLAAGVGRQTGRRSPAAADPGAAATDPAGPSAHPPGQLDLFAGQTPEQTPEQTVVELEQSLLTAAVRASSRTLDALLHQEWSEIGSSGRLLDRACTLADLGPTDATLEVIETARLADDVILLVWRARTPDRGSLRSSIWVREAGSWRQRFHQGTVETTEPRR